MARIESARRRVRIARYVIVGAAATVFAGLGVAARASHPGHAATKQAASAQAAIPGASSFALAAGATGASSTISPAPSSAPAVVQSAGS